jgi:hypothetical protein
MKFIKNRKVAFIVLLLVSILTGSLLGSMAVLADVTQVLSVGWNTISGTQDNSPAWSYNVSAREYMNAAKTEVDFDYAYYYNGDGDPTYNPYFQETLVYDQYFNDWTTYYTFNSAYVEGINRTCDPSPNFVMDTMSASNPYAILQQYVKYGAGRYSDYIIGWRQ